MISWNFRALITLVVMALALAANAAVSRNPNILTLNQLLALSDRQSVANRLSESNIAEAQASLDLANAGYWPEVSASGVIAPEIGGGSLTANYAIYNGGLTSAKSRLARNDKARSEVDFAATRQRTHLQVIRAYYGFALLKQKRAYQAKLVAQYAELAEFFRRAFARGAAGKQDSLLSHVAHRRAALAQDKLRYDIQNNLLSLQNLVQDPSITDEMMPDELTVGPFEDQDRSEVARQVLTNSKKLEAAKMGQASLDASREASLAPFKPQIFASLGYTWKSDYETITAYRGEDLFGSPLPQWRASLGIKIPIFNGFSTLALERSYAERQKQYDLGLTNIRSGLDQEIETQLNQLELARLSIEEADALIVKSSEAWELLRQEFKLGTVLTAFVYIQSLEELGELHMGRLGAVANYLTIRDGLRELRGEQK